MTDSRKTGSETKQNVSERFFSSSGSLPVLIIKNIRVYGYGDDLGEIRTVSVNERGELKLDDGLKDETTVSAASQVETIDANGECALMPGWLDSHVHGYGGPDFADASHENLPIIAKALGETGLSYCLATLVSLELSKLKTSLAAIDNYVVEQNKNPTPGAAQIVGVHLEGPYIAKNCKGAHDEAVLKDKISIEDFKDIIKSAPHITQWKITLAPDLEGAIDFIAATRNLEVDGRKINVKIFIGHTNAEEKLIDAAVSAGAVGFTHLGNANQETAHRCCGGGEHHHDDKKEERRLEEKDLKSNVVRWVVKNSQKNFYVELIVDGEHLSKEFVRMIKDKVGDRIVPITDALGPSGLKDGTYNLGTLKVVKMDQKFVLDSNREKLAGSAATYGFVVEKLVDWSKEVKKDMKSIYHTSVLSPRLSSLDSSFKLPDEKNFVILDKNGKLVMSFCNGKRINLSDTLAMKQRIGKSAST